MMMKVLEADSEPSEFNVADECVLPVLLLLLLLDDDVFVDLACFLLRYCRRASAMACAIKSMSNSWNSTL